MVNSKQRLALLASAKAHRVIIVGGGAAGLELATQLSDSSGFSVTLIDRVRTHVWKPKLHEIAAGTMDIASHEVGYLAHARKHGFEFRIGEMTRLDREGKEVWLAPYIDAEGEEVTPARSFGYDTLVIAVGSQSNDFGTPGVRENTLKLESLGDASRFNRKLMNACFRRQASALDDEPKALRVCIIGAGATGVELASELLRTGKEVYATGSTREVNRQGIEVHLIEAAERILPALPARLSFAASRLLAGQGVEVHTAAKVKAVHATDVELDDGRRLPAELTVWAAGIKAPAFLKELAGLESNRLGQLVVGPSLQTTRDARIFAIGDCAACPTTDGQGVVPPRAQAAHQQAQHLARHLHAYAKGRPVPGYRYRDFGSLISLGQFSTVGSLMGGLVGRSMFIEGLFAKSMYLAMYKKHELAIHGWRRMVLESLARMLSSGGRSRVKLH